MRIELNKTEDQIELIKAIASKDPNVAFEAKAAVAELVGPVISKVRTRQRLCGGCAFPGSSR